MTKEEFYSRALSFDEVGEQVDIFEKEKIKYEQEIERLNNIIKRFEEDLREMYLTFGEFSEEYTEKKIRELKGVDK